MFNPIRFIADEVTLDVDEDDGFELVITDTDGMVHRINIHALTPEFVKIGDRLSDYQRRA